ncbi:hypothetical protein PMAYCL1PPCAC_29173, partial [Pristionchus mayeri]
DGDDEFIYSSLQADRSEYSLSPSADAYDVQSINEPSLSFTDYNQSGDLCEGNGSRQYFQCINGEWKEVFSPSMPAIGRNSQLDDAKENVLYGDGVREYVMVIKTVEEEPQEEQQVIMIKDEEVQHLFPSNEYLRAAPKFEDSLDMMEIRDSSGNLLWPIDDGGHSFYSILNEATHDINANEDGVVYVNPKQYHRIVKRREARRKLANRIAPRGKYIHPSRHAVAVARKRGPGGQFGAGKTKKEQGDKREHSNRI